ncbi:hypothetical protein HF086_011260 [Spodoptera exigua]|uniref:Histone deacetylase complex subunit SAP130 C-terminal domain-containing protein n=1 Tax=Spodoptera exigua TaxID=7107 RepID=A0A922MH61_SPOEX|nr:hypothetical protein HF086_011260 [Spodoptera exigua]
MSNNLDNDRSLSSKMHPIDLAPQKITIVKSVSSVSSSDMKMTHLIPGQAKTAGSSQIIAHASPGTGLMRPGLAQIIASNVASQPQMIISGSPILQGAQIVSQGSQLISQGSQMSQSQLITPSGPLISPGTQIISQGTQLSAQVSNANTVGSSNVQSSVTSSVSGTQVLNVGSQLVSGAGNLVVNSSVRTLPPAVRVLPPLPHHNNRPAVLSSVQVSSASGVLVSKGVGVGVTSHVSHVPRGLAAGASLAVRPVTPASNTQAASASVGVRGVVGNSAPTQLYYEVPRGAQGGPPSAPPSAPPAAPLAGHVGAALPRALAPYLHQSSTQPQQTQVTVVNAVSASPETRVPVSSVPAQTVLPRPSILRKRDLDGSPSKNSSFGRSGWEDVPVGGCGAGSGGSTTISASSSPAPDDEPEPPRPDPDLSPRKKPRKQMLSNEVRQCDYQGEEPPPTPPPVSFNPPKRPLLSSSYVCGWRSTALHFTRPSDVRRREPRARDIVAIASQKHVLTSAEGWKVHHLTAQMDDLMSLESDVGEQLAGLLRALETASGRAISALQPHSHTILELLKGNIQRSKIVCEGIQEAREDILRVFTHRNFVSDILTRQADKRCFRKHRSQS